MMPVMFTPLARTESTTIPWRRLSQTLICEVTNAATACMRRDGSSPSRVKRKLSGRGDVDEFTGTLGEGATLEFDHEKGHAPGNVTPLRSAGVRATAATIASVVGYDLLQRRRAILRNVPIAGHLRYLLEAFGPELRQYIVTSKRNGGGRESPDHQALAVPGACAGGRRARRPPGPTGRPRPRCWAGATRDVMPSTPGRS
jgi:hypothetical protein